MFINRPLNAFNADSAFRLASYPKTNYEHVKSSTVFNLEALGHGSGSEPIHFILDLVKQMDETLPLIKNVFEWENYRMSGITVFSLLTIFL